MTDFTTKFAPVNTDSAAIEPQSEPASGSSLVQQADSPVPHDLTAYAFAPAHQQAQALAQGQFTAVALLEHTLARIAQFNPALNAIVARDDHAARAAAQAADAALARGERLPLLGVPITLKENFGIAGYVTSVGDPAWAHNLVEHDAPAVAALRAAGAVIIGKTNVPLALADLQSYNAVYGVTNNPWNLAHSPGGSSGGSAAAVAAGLSALDIGTDIGGSIRIPAHFTGVFGHKPSVGLVYNGGLGVPPGKLSLRDLSVAGPLARSAADLSLALQVLLNQDPLAKKAWRAELPPARHNNLQDFRVLVLDQWPNEEASLSEQWVGKRLRNLVQQVGAKPVTLADLPDGLWPDLEQAHVLYRGLLASSIAPATASTTVPVTASQDVLAEPFAQNAADAPASAPSPQTQSKSNAADAYAQFQRGAAISHGEWLEQHEQRLQLRNRWEQVFEWVDVILTPVLSTSAFAHQNTQAKEQRLFPVAYAEGVRNLHFYGFFNWAGLPVLPGLPATSFPLGLGEDGLPVGAQAMGPFLEDQTPLQFVHLLEQAGRVQFAPPPGYGAAPL